MLVVKLHKKNTVAPTPASSEEMDNIVTEPQVSDPSEEMDWIEDISFLATSGSDEKYELMTLRLLFDGEDHAWTLMALQRLFEEKVMTPTISIHDPKDGNFYWIFHFIKPIFETPEKVFLLTSTFINKALYRSKGYTCLEYSCEVVLRAKKFIPSYSK